MEKMRICVEEFDTYKDPFPLWSIIYICYGTSCFPSDQWWDATSAILEIWIYNVCRLLSGEASRCELNFMDGEYAVELTMATRYEASIVLHDEDSVKPLDGNVDILYFARQLLSASEKTLIAYQGEVGQPASQRLASASDKLRLLIREYRRSH